MLISEMIVGLWFVPVVLNILIPLFMLCGWGCFQLLKIIMHVGTSTKETEEKSPETDLQPHPAA